MDKKNSNMYINKYGTEIWEDSNSYYHRLDGPAVIYKTGDKEWYVNGLYHRADGPAFERVNGDKFWRLSGHSFLKKEFNSWKKRITFIFFCKMIHYHKKYRE